MVIWNVQIIFDELVLFARLYSSVFVFDNHGHFIINYFLCSLYYFFKQSKCQNR